MSVRTIDFRYRILRNGADFCAVRPPSDGWPSLQMNADAVIRTSLRGSFLPPAEDVNWLADEICPELIIDGTAYSLGIFMPATVDQIDTETGSRIQIEAYDRSWKVRDSRLTERQYFAAGTNYISAAASLLAAAGIGTIHATPTDLVMPEAREDWEIGTSRLDIINELLTEIGYRRLWFDADGMARLEPYEAISAVNIRHRISDQDVRSLLLPGMNRQTDVYNAPNVFVAVCSNPDKSGGMIATAENYSGQSPISITRRGRKIVQVTRLNNIASQAELQAYVDRQLTDSLLSGESLTVTTGLLPGFDSGEVTSLQYGDLFAICREKAYTMDLRVGGNMVHTLEREVINIG